MTAKLHPTSEKEFQRQVLDLAKIYGWTAYHPLLSKWSERGWPDLVLCRPPRLILAELKAEKGIVSEHQERWLSMLRDCPGVETFVWRPSDLGDLPVVLGR